MRADPRPGGGDFSRQRIERGARLPLMERIHPHEHTIDRQQLLADLIGEFLVVDRSLRIDADRGQIFEDAMKAIVLRRCSPPCFGVTAPKNRDRGAFGTRFTFRHATFLA
jgi:hypothetical protein